MVAIYPGPEEYKTRFGVGQKNLARDSLHEPIGPHNPVKVQRLTQQDRLGWQRSTASSASQRYRGVVSDQLDRGWNSFYAARARKAIKVLILGK